MRNSGCLARPIGTDQSDFFAGIQLKRSIHEEQLLAILLILTSEKKVILKEQLAARCLLQFSPPRKLPANAGTFGLLEVCP